eukprot:TRINITY_DN7790_c0_g1_i13.p1 TRINITY_DN7790_c0_g1~~TRINITY_DN7790_c0_g1_i13.p1  ORF type:complete len:839 (-),score=227.84 TRINITY_DN7790_c0_g1_i13:710-3172(-)
MYNMEHCGLISVVKLEYREMYIPVPLKGIKISSQLVNYVAQVTVQQKYVNVEENPIECEYMFPIEEESAVIDFKAELEGRTLVSKVKPNAEAEKDYKEAVEQGRTGFLAQSVRPDMLQMKVGHLSPGAACTITLTYIMEAALDAEGNKVRLTIPTTISPKYVPYHDRSDEAKKISSIQYDFNTPAPMSFSVSCTMKTKIEEVTSPSHDIRVVGQEEEADAKDLHHAKAELSSTTTDMDRDIVVLVKCASAKSSIILREENEESSVMMLSLVPDLKLKNDPQLDVVFLIDCSGSMMGSSIKLARDAMNILLHSLIHSVHFNIIRFGSSYKKIFEKSVPYTDKTLKVARSHMNKLEADLGGTEILSPLKMLLEEKTELPRRIFVLTDGSVSNSMECIKVARRHNKTARVFALGIGSAADRHLVKGLARAGNGTSDFTVEGEMIAPKVIKQLKNCLQPSLSDVSIDWGKSVTKENSQQAPSVVPSLYNNSRLQIFRMFDKSQALPDAISISAKIPSDKEEKYEETVKVGQDSDALQGDLLHKMFARKMIQQLEENEDYGTENVKELITELAMKYKLMSKHTSIVAVDTKENKSEFPMQSRHIPNQVPHGFHGNSMRMYSMPMAACASGAMISWRSAPVSKNKMSKRSYLFAANAISSPSYAPTSPGRRNSEPDSSEECDYDSSYAMETDCVLGSSPPSLFGKLKSAFGGGKISSDAFGGMKMSNEESDMDKVLALISLQTAEGYFVKDDKIYSILNIDKQEIKKIGGDLDARVLYTLLVTLALAKKFPELKACWDLVADKAETYLAKQTVPQDIKDKIEQLLA